jgi:hypothetical protein
MPLRGIVGAGANLNWFVGQRVDHRPAQVIGPVCIKRSFGSLRGQRRHQRRQRKQPGKPTVEAG